MQPLPRGRHAGDDDLERRRNSLECGADVVKIFPGDRGRLKAIKAIHGPLPQAPLMPTGGVNVDNAGEWMQPAASLSEPEEP